MPWLAQPHPGSRAGLVTGEPGRTCPRSQTAGSATLRRLRAAAGSVDLVTAHGSSTLPACAVALAGSTPFAYVNIGDPRAWQTSATRRLRSRAFMARSRAAVAIAERSALALRELLAVPADRIRVIPNFRSSARFHPLSAVERQQVRAGLGVPDDAPLVVYLGSLSPRSGPIS